MKETVGEDVTSDENIIRELIDHFAEAFRAKDIDGVMSVFATKIVSYDILPPLKTEGAEAFAKHWEEFFESFEGPIEVEFPDLTVTTAHDVAFSYCLHRIQGTTKDGRYTDLWLRWTACYRNINGKWLIVHEQVSVPVDFENGHALLHLKP
jgi:uncharacterized protein (TIGR02246 family)